MPPIPITGLGALTSQGLSVDATWQGVLHARNTLHPWSRAPKHLAHLHVAECPPLPRPADLPARFWNPLSRTQQLAALALDEALQSAHLPHTFPPDKPVGLFLATTVCGMDTSERYYARYRHNPDAADINLLKRLQPYEVADLLRRRHHIGAPELTQVCLSTCVGSAMAIGAAADAIALGECDIAIAGGAEALCQVVLSGFHSLKVVAPDGCRPFDLNRPGITVGEGAGILILESESHAKKRNAPIHGYLRGFSLTCDAHHITAPDPNATQALRAISDALARANLSPTDIDYINAHGTGTRDNDAMESRAFSALFPSPNLPPISSTKRCTGHTFGAAGAIEAILCLQALRHQQLPPNAGTLTPDPALIPTAQTTTSPRPLRHTLSTNFAFGGNNTALLLSKDPT